MVAIPIAAGVLMAGLVGAAAAYFWHAWMTTQALLVRVPMDPPWHALWVRWRAQDHALEEHRTLWLRELPLLIESYAETLASMGIVPGLGWTGPWLEGLTIEVRSSKEPHPELGQIWGEWLGYHSAPSLWVALEADAFPAPLILHELEHGRDQLVSGLSARDWAAGNARGRHFLDPRQTQEVINAAIKAYWRASTDAAQAREGVV